MSKRGSVVKYVVRMNADERLQLEDMIRTGRHAAYRLLKARILLKADVSSDGGGWDDERIAEALGTSVSTVYRTRRQLVEEGLEAALARKKQKRPSRPAIFDGTAEAKLIALACSEPPKGMRVGLCAFWKSAWSNWVSLRQPATARSIACSKKRAQTPQESLLGNPSKSQCCLRCCDGRCTGGLHAPL